MKRSAAERTLFMSVMLSIPGPIVLGVGLFLGRSSTQLADLVRRTAELAAIIVSLVMYKAVQRRDLPMEKRRLEGTANISVGAAMCLSGILMAALALWALPANEGNVILPLVIAVLGLVTNSWLWLRYVRHHRTEPSPILLVQAKLYRAKSLVDLCVTGALAAVTIAPQSDIARVLDSGGSVVVSAYLFASGVSAVRAGASRLSRQACEDAEEGPPPTDH